jgi:acetylornithine deacetylase/succinyl-diaminopimelate desuccinylase-like protein
LDQIHGVGERISVADYGRVVRFYHQFLRNADDL